MNNGFKIIGSLKYFHRVTDWINCLAYFERYVFIPIVSAPLLSSRLLSPGGTSPSSVTADTTISLNDLLMFPGACIDRSTVLLFLLFFEQLLSILESYRCLF